MSDDVCILTPTEPAVAFPIVKPVIVTVKTEGSIDAPDIVNTMAVTVMLPHAAVRPEMLLASALTTGGLGDSAKKFGG